jgi:N-acylneuraminate cytidylyltransferase
MLSEKTSDDHATTADVIEEVLASYRAQGDRFDFACCLYPTAPFVQAQDLTDGLKLLEAGNYDVIMPIVKFDYPIWRSLKRDLTGKIVLNFPENLNVRSQDFPAAYHDAGQWYWFCVKAFEKNGVLMGPNTGSVILPQSRVQDIDTEDDWLMAEMKHKKALG